MLFPLHIGGQGDLDAILNTGIFMNNIDMADVHIMVNGVKCNDGFGLWMCMVFTRTSVSQEFIIITFTISGMPEITLAIQQADIRDGYAREWKNS